MQSTTQAAPAAIAPETLSTLFIADAALRRLCDCFTLQQHPLEGFAPPALSQTVLHLIVGDISDRVAEATNALLAAQETQP